MTTTAPSRPARKRTDDKERTRTRPASPPAPPVRRQTSRGPASSGSSSGSASPATKPAAPQQFRGSPSTRGTAPRRSAAAAPGRRGRPARVPFVLLLVGLLGGGLISLLLLHTILQQGSFQLQSLREQHTSLTYQKETLKQDVAYLSSPEVIANKARTLNMRPGNDQSFVHRKDGTIYGESGQTLPPERGERGEPGQHSTGGKRGGAGR